MSLKEFIFRYRSYTPLPFAFLLLLQANLRLGGVIGGLVLILLGELIRLKAVRIAGGRTRTRKVGAKVLATNGIYGHVRNPLYIGNMLIYIGMALFAGGPYCIILMIVALVYFTFQYSLIVTLEEEKLYELFGDEYREYAEHVPRLIPRIRTRQWSERAKKVSWASVFRAERSTLINQGFFLLLIVLKELLI